MLVVVVYNELINETLNLVNEYTHTYTYIHIRRLGHSYLILCSA